MAQAVWTGTLTFGLVTIPVKLYTATTPRDVRFRELARDTGALIRHLRIGTADERLEDRPEPGEEPGQTPGEASGGALPGGQRADGEATTAGQAGWDAADEPPPSAAAVRASEVAYDDVVKGYEIEPGRFVTLSREELQALRPEATRTIEIEEFVDLDRIDPVYFEKSYYLVPQRGVGGERPYALLLRAMEEARKVGVGRFVLRSKEYLAAVRPMDGVLGLETLYFADEVRPVEEVGAPPAGQAVDRRELDMAVTLIGMLASEWDPTRYRDTYRERVLELIESKRGTGSLVEPEPAAAPSKSVADLMAALQASVEAVKDQTKTTERRRRTRRTG
jgi:DNA end-binding protein Ku